MYLSIKSSCSGLRKFLKTFQASEELFNSYKTDVSESMGLEMKKVFWGGCHYYAFVLGVKILTLPIIKINSVFLKAYQLIPFIGYLHWQTVFSVQIDNGARATVSSISISSRNKSFILICSHFS